VNDQTWGKSDVSPDPKSGNHSCSASYCLQLLLSISSSYKLLENMLIQNLPIHYLEPPASQQRGFCHNKQS